MEDEGWRVSDTAYSILRPPTFIHQIRRPQTILPIASRLSRRDGSRRIRPSRNHHPMSDSPRLTSLKHDESTLDELRRYL
jgi:hypothetical protein